MSHSWRSVFFFYRVRNLGFPTHVCILLSAVVFCLLLPHSVERIPLPLSSNPNASGLALTDDGFDEPVGCIPWTGYLPAGRIRDEILCAAISPTAVSEDWSRLLDLTAALVLTRDLKKSLEAPVQSSWDLRINRWFPPIDDVRRRSTNARPSFPVPLVIAKSCNVDYIRFVEFKQQPSAASLGSTVASAVLEPPTAADPSGAAASIPYAVAVFADLPIIARAITAVAEFKNTIYHPIDGEPQALVAAFSAVIDLHAKGLRPEQCVVPFIINTGLLEQMGVAYLAGTAPCAVLTTPVVDLADPIGQRIIATARLAFVEIARRTEDLLLKLPCEFLASAVSVVPSLDADLFMWKKPLPLFGDAAIPHAVLHQFRVFLALSKSAAAQYVVEPVAALMQSPPKSALKRAVPAQHGGSAASSEPARSMRSHAGNVSTSSDESWLKETTMVFSRLHGFASGVPAPGHGYREAVLAELRVALRQFHAAGIVHMDLFSSNVMWCVSGDGGAGAGAIRPGVTIRLVDLDASLFVGEPVPSDVARIIDRNGHTGSYHPLLFRAGQVAIPEFDWWHFVLLSDDSCPFSSSGSALDLARWLQLEGKRESVLDRVRGEIDEEHRAAGGTPSLVVAVPEGPADSDPSTSSPAGSKRARKPAALPVAL